MSAVPDHLDQRAKDLFADALDQPESARASFLARHCGADARLRREVESLLCSHVAAADSLFESHEQLGERPGDHIGNYKLLQKIGEGGFGTVWMADQLAPVRRKVALKVLKPGLDTQHVIARFEAERQALALMDHPSIAKVFDGGATAHGRPYFVMELVYGVPITKYSDEAALSPRERVELFVTVCHAVQHAHQKGVIHRDLKPSNVLVTLHDGTPVPKVIDFGIAKATSAELTQRTMFTEFRHMLGTPEYMAPEQAELSGLGVDTRADVYSLGVLLYELLTGTRPFELNTLLAAGYAEMVRTLKETDPPKPSTRVSTLGDQLLDVAKHRKVHPRSLGALMRGDLDWVVMKALEKERSRRYDSASALAEDLLRHLHDQPVQAGPPSSLYRLRKYVSRHRLGVTAAASIAASLLVGLGAAVAGYVEATDQAQLAHSAEQRMAAALLAEQEHASAARLARADADEQRRLAEQREALARRETAKATHVVELLQAMLGSSDPREVKGRDYTVRQLLDDFDVGVGARLAAEPEVEAALRQAIGVSYHGLGLADKAERHLTRALDLRRPLPGGADRELALLENDLCMALLAQDRLPEAEARCRHALELLRGAVGEETDEAASFLNNLALIQQRQGRLTEATTTYRQAVAMHHRVHGDDCHGLAVAEANLASALSDADLHAEAEATARRAVASCLRLFSPDHPHTADVRRLLARVLARAGKFEDARSQIRDALATTRMLFGERHLFVAKLLLDAGWLAYQARDMGEAEDFGRRAREMLAALGLEAHPTAAAALRLSADIHRERGQLVDAERDYAQALALCRQLHGEEHGAVIEADIGLAWVLTLQGRPTEAEAMYRRLVESSRKLFGEGHENFASSLGNLAFVLLEQGRVDEAEPLQRRTLAIRRARFGDEHVTVADGMAMLAQIRAAAGEPAEAVALHRDALAMRIRLHGEAQRDVASGLNNLGSALMALAQFAEAETALRRAVDLYRQSMGSDLVAGGGIDALSALMNLAAVLRRNGQLADAEIVAREALALHERIRGSEHPRVAVSVGELAATLHLAGKLDEAEALHRRGVEVYRTRRGAEFAARGGIDAAHALSNLTAVLHDAVKLAEAESNGREALSLYERVRGSDHDDTVDARNRLAGILRDAGQLDESAKLLRQNVTTLRAARSAQDPELATQLASLARVLLLQANPADAETAARECLSIRRATGATTRSQHLATALVGRALAAQGRFGEAEPLLVEACTELQPVGASDRRPTINASLGEALEALIQLLEGQGKSAQAAPWRAKLAVLPGPRNSADAGR